jgi:hypothetical protein
MVHAVIEMEPEVLGLGIFDSEKSASGSPLEVRRKDDNKIVDAMRKIVSVKF